MSDTGQVSWCHGVLVNYDNYTLSYIRVVGRNMRNLTLSSADLCVRVERLTTCDSGWHVWSVMTYNWHLISWAKYQKKIFFLWFLSCVNLSRFCLSFPGSHKKLSSHLLSWAVVSRVFVKSQMLISLTVLTARGKTLLWSISKLLNFTPRPDKN